MGKNIFVIIFLFCLKSFCFSQTSYQFDYNLKLRSNQSAQKNIDFTYIINSKEPLYGMYLYDDAKGAIFDNKENIRRNFNYRIKAKEIMIHQFLKETSFVSYDEIKIEHIIVEKIKENKYSIKCYPEKDNKNSNLELMVYLKPFNEDVIRFYYLDLSNHIQTRIIDSLKEKLNGNYNYVVERYTVDYKNGAISTNSLKKIDKINFRIEPPK
ncbi:hypothetical protein [Chryseobacterium rhizosphaerae]|uniref:hypothetical protein n=1 Tax=Chryseobacterium rhizosphaerae TaxID=395937 RepID=UPI0023582ED2|nr:hypothetical protein [Chryseobacterium rhizosphaerae]MDC8100045.1 hypothetical protein [Chryseobacterium rhizosphaerae]